MSRRCRRKRRVSARVVAVRRAEMIVVVVVMAIAHRAETLAVIAISARLAKNAASALRAKIVASRHHAKIVASRHRAKSAHSQHPSVVNIRRRVLTQRAKSVATPHRASNVRGNHARTRLRSVNVPISRVIVAHRATIVRRVAVLASATVALPTVANVEKAASPVRVSTSRVLHTQHRRRDLHSFAPSEMNRRLRINRAPSVGAISLRVQQSRRPLRAAIVPRGALQAEYAARVARGEAE
jgi:hypothetical protein